jgi:pyruvate dehydrogenase E2 component (dihydrolipoamide acetyltransferase)
MSVSRITTILAKDVCVNLAKVKGAGRKGRIQKEDVQAYVKEAIKRAESAPAGVSGGAGLGVLPWPKVDFAKFGPVEEIELTRIQKISGPNLHRNWVVIPHVTQLRCRLGPEIFWLRGYGILPYPPT